MGLKKQSCEKLLSAYRKAIEAGQSDIADVLEGLIIDEMMKDSIFVSGSRAVSDGLSINPVRDLPTYGNVQLTKIEPVKTTPTVPSPGVTWTITSAEGFEPTTEVSE